MKLLNLTKVKYDETIAEEYQEVYNFFDFNKPILFGTFFDKNIISKDLAKGIYFMTYGGGPEGGFVLTPSGNIFEVERNWGTPFNVKKTIYNKINLMKSKDGIFYINPTF